MQAGPGTADLTVGGEPEHHSEPVEILGGQVDPAVGQVLPDVAQDVRLLQGDPERVGQGHRPRRCPAHAEHAEAEPADRTGHAAAVADQVVERLIPVPPDVHLHAVDKFLEGEQGEGEQGGCVAQRQQNGIGRLRVARSRFAHRLSGRGEPVELDLLGHVAVADVVDAAGEGVHGVHPRPLVPGQQPDSVVEVARLGTGDDLASGVGLTQCRVGRQRHLPTRHRARACRATSRRRARAREPRTSKSTRRRPSIAARPPAT